MFWASTALVAVFWAITPLQAGIFATDALIRTVPQQVRVSDDVSPPINQQQTISANYTYSTYAIAWLNETLPAFMTREYAIAPFKLDDTTSSPSGNLTAPTKLYGLDLTCEEAKHPTSNCNPPDCEPSSRILTSSWGCMVPVAFGPSGNDTIGPNIKAFSALYVGYNSSDGQADYSLDDQQCPSNVSHTFFASVARNKKHESDPPNPPLKIFCSPHYYWREANVTVSGGNLSVLEATATGPKIAIPEDIFDSSLFESQLADGGVSFFGRSQIPSSDWPDSSDRLASLNLTVPSNAAGKMVTMAFGAYQRPTTDEYLDNETFMAAWEASYRLLFSRYMIDFLGKTFNESHLAAGTMQYETQAVIVVPLFARLVQGFLAVVASLALIILYQALTARNKLCSDPASIQASMTLVADDYSLLASFNDCDGLSNKQIKMSLQDRRYFLDSKDGKTVVIPQIGINDDAVSSLKQEKLALDHDKSVRPTEFKMVSILGFFLLNASLVVVLAVLFWRSRTYGQFIIYVVLVAYAYLL